MWKVITEAKGLIARHPYWATAISIPVIVVGVGTAVAVSALFSSNCSGNMPCEGQGVLVLLWYMLLRSGGMFFLVFILIVLCVPALTFFLSYLLSNLITKKP